MTRNEAIDRIWHATQGASNVNIEWLLDALAALGLLKLDACEDSPGTRVALSDAQIKHMVNRFLGWRLPENFCPDGGVSFKPTFNDHLPVPMRHNPSGTNLLDATQALAMVRYMIEGLP